MNIYVANLDYSVNAQNLRELFAAYGEVDSAKVIMDRETGRSRGFGFVEMGNDEDGQRAIDQLNQSEYEGKVIRVSVARPRTEKPQGQRGHFNRERTGQGRQPHRRDSEKHAE